MAKCGRVVGIYVGEVWGLDPAGPSRRERVWLQRSWAQDGRAAVGLGFFFFKLVINSF